MSEQPLAVTAYPARLLDDHLRVLGTKDGTLLAAALHLRSVDARALFAHAARADGATVEELVDAARAAAPPAAGVTAAGLGELAQLLALQDLLPDDTTTALALFEQALAAFGAHAVAPSHQGCHVQLAFHLGRRNRAATLLDVYRQVPERIRASVALDLANPFHCGEGDLAAWFGRFAALLPRCGLRLRDGDAPPIDRLTAEVPPVEGPQRVTSVVTTFRPGAALLTAVRSLVAQSWRNHEILVVDDGSPATYDGVLQACADLDPRVRLLRLPVNGGTYIARNAALDAATGEFVTFQDSDDWSHPCRLEHQLRPLLADPALFATTSVGMRVHEDLVATRLGLTDHRSYNLSSLMFRRDVALDRLGYLDPVRKGADAEYVERARAVFGRQAVRHLGGAPYALIRLSSGSLSGGDIRVGWMHPARHAYLSAFQAWHRRVANGLDHAWRPREPADRPFPVPHHLRRAPATATSAAEPAPLPHYDVILADDWTNPQGGAVSQLRALTQHGLRVAVLHLDALRHLTGRPQNLDANVQELINDGTVHQVVVTDEVDADLLLVRTPAVLLFAQHPAGRIHPGRVAIQAEEPPSDGHRPIYVPAVCTAAAQRIFGIRPVWCPQDPLVRERLAADRGRPQLTDFDLPATVDSDQWRFDRRTVRAGRPVLGRRIGGDAAPASAAEQRGLTEVLPLDAGVDVRLWVGDPAWEPLDTRAFPHTWLVFDGTEVSARSFLYQLDYYAHFPAPSSGIPVAVLEAMAAGCVAVLPPRYADIIGDAAVYCDAEALPEVVSRLHKTPDEFIEQSRRGQRYASGHHGCRVYVDRVTQLIPRKSIPRQ